MLFLMTASNVVLAQQSAPLALSAKATLNTKSTLMPASSVVHAQLLALSELPLRHNQA